MTRTANARLAGFTFLFYIAVGVAQMIVGRGVSGGEGTAARLASIVRHAPQVRANMMLGLVTCFTALALAAALYGLTRDEDQDLALLALACRVAEGLLGALSILTSLELLWLATRTTSAADAAGGGAYAIADSLLALRGWLPTVGATFFAVGSTIFSYLLLRGRLIPVALAWLGVVASVLLVVGLPLQLVGFLHGRVVTLMWIPMAAFEVPLGLWLLVRGAAPPASMKQGGRPPRQPHSTAQQPHFTAEYAENRTPVGSSRRPLR